MNPSSLLGLRQPDRRTCGPSCLVAARMLLDPAFALSVRRLGWDGEVLATHRRTTGPVAADGRLQAPWPPALGTPPWALARELSSYGVPFDVRAIRWDPRACLARIHEGVAHGHPVPLYVGSRWLPRHVVLAVDRAPENLTVYEPASGALCDVTDAALLDRHLSLAGWTTPWFAVTPVASSSRSTAGGDV